MTTDQHYLDDLVRRLSPADDEAVRAALDDDAETFSHDIMATPQVAELPRVVQGGSQRRPRQVFRPVVATVAVIVFSVATLMFLPFGTDRQAIAGWGPEPSEAPAELLDTAASACTPPAGAGTEEDELRSFLLAAPLFGLDARGNAAAAVFADEAQFFICNLVEGEGTWRFSSGQHGLFADTDVTTIDAAAEHQWAYGEMTVTTVAGRVGTAVERVIVDLEDGSELEATVDDGMFVAWWPSTTPFTNAAAYDADGELLGTDDSVFTGGFSSEQ